MAELGGRLAFIKALEIAIVPLIQSPVTCLFFQLLQICFGLDEFVSVSRPLQKRVSTAFNFDSGLLNQLTCSFGLLNSRLIQRHVCPACEPVFVVPGRLAVSNQYHLLVSRRL